MRMCKVYVMTITHLHPQQQRQVGSRDYFRLVVQGGGLVQLEPQSPSRSGGGGDRVEWVLHEWGFSLLFAEVPKNLGPH